MTSVKLEGTYRKPSCGAALIASRRCPGFASARHLETWDRAPSSASARACSSTNGHGWRRSWRPCRASCPSPCDSDEPLPIVDEEPGEPEPSSRRSLWGPSPRFEEPVPVVPVEPLIPEPVRPLMPYRRWTMSQYRQRPCRRRRAACLGEGEAAHGERSAERGGDQGVAKLHDDVLIGVVEGRRRAAVEVRRASRTNSGNTRAQHCAGAVSAPELAGPPRARTAGTVSVHSGHDCCTSRLA